MRLASLHKLLSFNSADAWHDAVSSLWTEDDSWIVEDVAYGVEELPKEVHFVIYKRLEELIAFLIGHRPFADDLTYAPCRTFNDDVEPPARMYHELHSADWWWETQEKLPLGATVVPVIILVDKTQLLMHQGDVVAWPVYITIGNLNREARRKRTTPAALLAGFVPPIKKDANIDKYAQRRAYHYAMAWILACKSNPHFPLLQSITVN